MRRAARAILEFWSDMRAQKLRTVLTILGIAWGTVAVVVLLAFAAVCTLTGVVLLSRHRHFSGATT